MIATYPNAFLRHAAVYEVDELGCLSADDPEIELVVQTRSPRLSSFDEHADKQGERLLLPVFNSDQLVSIVELQLGGPDEFTGVTEIWEPVGLYDEVRLTAGSYGNLDRFQNVSSFVRFEKGSGLPGQVWQTSQTVIHDDLAHHPGFLRAAGASAGLLHTAIGIPVVADQFLATVVLIGSKTTPIATACEVWKSIDNQFMLEAASYLPDAEDSQFDVDQPMATDVGLLGLVQHRGGAVVTTDQTILMADRPRWNEFSLGLAIPAFFDGQITSVTKLLF